MGRRRPAAPLPSTPSDTLHGALVDEEVDLHGLREYQALHRVDGLLDRWCRSRPGAVIRIITGKGTRSASGPVLLGAVEEALRDELGGRVADLTLDAGGGGWMVRVGRPAKG